MSEIETPLQAVLRGALAGLAGGLAIMLAIQSAEQLMSTPPSLPEGPPPEEPREKLVRKVATGIFEVQLSEEQRAAWAQALHWMYSAAWGMIFGIVRSSLQMPEWLRGLFWGTIVWIKGPVLLLPAMKLAPPPQSLPLSMSVMNWGFHLIYGLTTVYVYRFLSSVNNNRPD